MVNGLRGSKVCVGGLANQLAGIFYSQEHVGEHDQSNTVSSKVHSSGGENGDQVKGSSR